MLKVVHLAQRDSHDGGAFRRRSASGSRAASSPIPESAMLVPVSPPETQSRARQLTIHWGPLATLPNILYVTIHFLAVEIL
jgi:hypothetical protein